jgi:positive regulator of sigma E activity
MDIKKAFREKAVFTWAATLLTFFILVVVTQAITENERIHLAGLLGATGVATIVFFKFKDWFS